MKINSRLFIILCLISCSFACTSISSHIVSHQYVVETLVKPNGLDLNQVTQINILLDDHIYDEFLPENYYNERTTLADVSSDLSGDAVISAVSDNSTDTIADGTADETVTAKAAQPESVKRSPFSKEEQARKKALNRKKYRTFQFALCLKDYVETYYHNRGLQKPKVTVLTKPKNFFGYEFTICIDKLDLDLTSDWESVDRTADVSGDKIICYHNNIKFRRGVNAVISAKLMRFDEAKYEEDLTDDVSYTIYSTNCIEKTYKNVESMAKGAKLVSKTEVYAKQNIREISRKLLYRGAIDKIFRRTFGETLIPTSKDVVYFKYGKGEHFSHAQACLRHGRYDEALAVWEEIFDDETNPTFARGIAAYNIGMCKTLERDYEAANMYFSISEDLRKDGLQNLERF